MMTTERVLETEADMEFLIRFLRQHKLPCTVTVVHGKRRTNPQNKLQRRWMQEISEQRGDMTPEEARGYCKLTIGVPILREENSDFRAKYDQFVRPLPYEQKMAFMMEPLDFPVTRLMTTRQKTAFLDGIHRHFSEQGIVLTIPVEREARAA